MSHVPKIQQALGVVRAARARVADLRKTDDNPRARIKDAQVRADYLEKGKTNKESLARITETRVDSRRSTSRSSGGNSTARQGSKVVPKLDANLNQRTSAFVKSPSGPSPRPEGARLFKLEEHEDDPPVAFASSSTKKPAFIEQSEAAIMTRHGAGIRYRGTEYITNLTTPGTPVGRGQILYCLPISPNSLQSTRLSLAASMFTRYIFKSIKFYYAGTAPTTTAGSMMMYGDYDPTQNPGQSPGDGALRFSYTHNAAEFSVWQQASVEITDKVYEDMLYCDPDDELRWSTQGCFWLLSSGGIAANLDCGKLIVEYEIDFAVPDYRGPIAVPVVTSQTLTVGILSAGASLKFSTFTGTRGCYLVRLDTDPTLQVTFNTSVNAYDSGTPALNLQKGMCFFCVTSTSNVQIMDVLWTPDLYAQQNMANLTCVLNLATTANSTFSATIFPLTAVSND